MANGKQESTNALGRQWALLKKIPRYPFKKTASQLREELESEGFRVQKRTIERDLVSLAEMSPLACDEREKPFGWSWARDAAGLHLPGMTASEALAFQMIERFIKPLLPASTVDSLQPYLRASADKLNEVTHSRIAAWTKKVRVVHPAQLLIPPTTNPAIHRAVTEALLKNCQMEIVYRKRGDSATRTHIVNPLALVQRGPVTYFVVSQCKEPFYLSMHRIVRASILESAAHGPTDFDLDAHIAAGHFGFGVCKSIRLHAVFDEEAAQHLYDSPLSADQKLTQLAGGRVQLVATILHNRQLEWWIQSFGEQVEVIKPAELRRQIRKSARTLVNLYDR